MENYKQSAYNGSPERNEPLIQSVNDAPTTIDTTASRVLLDRLIAGGFTWEEAVRMLSLHEHLYENAEVLQRLHDDPRLRFARWLKAQGEISEFPAA